MTSVLCNLDSDGGIAQLGERLPCTQEANGSNPFTSTNQFFDLSVVFNIC